MKKILLAILTTFLVSHNNFAQEIDSAQLANDSLQIKIDEIEKSLTYSTGVIELQPGNAKLTVPDGFRYLDKKQSMYVLTDLWGNPPDSSIIGMLVPANKGVLKGNPWAFTISFNEMGYVKDDDADNINYDDLLKQLQKEFKEDNPERVKQGYQPIDFIGWASAPYYDSKKKVLHWAKELKFGTDSLNVLNYDLRVLGRKGIFMMSAVGEMGALAEVKKNIDKVIGSVEFKDGNKYSDFMPDIDKVAAWTIGGLVAGKILAKVGIFVLLAKFWKIIALAVAGAGGAIWKFITGKRKKKEQEVKDKEEPPALS